jgi:hypothetical protein
LRIHRVSEHEGPAKRIIEGIGDDSQPGIHKPIVQGLGVIGLEPQCDAPAETLDRLQVNGGLTHGKGNRSGGNDDRFRWALGCPFEVKLLFAVPPVQSSPCWFTPGTVGQEGQKLFGMAGKLSLGEASNEISKRHGLIEHESAVGQQTGRYWRIVLGVAEHRSAQCAESLALHADAISQTNVTAGECGYAIYCPGVLGYPVVVGRVHSRSDGGDGGDSDGVDDGDMRQDLISGPFAGRCRGGDFGIGH